jgi:signal transduction histidine kinase
MRFPRAVVAHRWQSWLLVTALLALVVTGVLVWDLTRNLKTVIISETNRSLANAVKELSQELRQSGVSPDAPIGSWEELDVRLKKTSYETLRFYFDVEGGYLLDQDVIGHSFPTYTEPGSALKQPPLEHAEVLDALQESRQNGNVAQRVKADGRDLVVVSVLAQPTGRIAAWSLRRILNFSDTGELRKRYLLVGTMIVSLMSILIVLRLSFSLQHGFRVIRSGLRRLEADPNYRIPDQNHELSSFVQAINTMAENRQTLEAELRREDRLRSMGRVVAGIAHEIRNPLNSIRLTARVLARRLQDNPTTTDQIDMIIGEIDRLDALLKSLLLFRRDEAGVVCRQPILPIIERSLAVVQPHALERGIVLRLDQPAQADASVDSDQLQQAMMNLLLNAVDASTPGGVVSVRMQKTADNHIEIAVEDSGPGLSAESQDQVFEAFYTTKPGGTGLGLAVTKTVLEKMGATINAANYANGARFTIQLPREAAS